MNHKKRIISILYFIVVWITCVAQNPVYSPNTLDDVFFSFSGGRIFIDTPEETINQRCISAVDYDDMCIIVKLKDRAFRLYFEDLWITQVTEYIIEDEWYIKNVYHFISDENEEF